MDVYGNIAKALKDLSREARPSIFTAKVKAVSGTTCSIEVGRLLLTDVRLRAVVDSDTEQLLVTPRVGSQVLVADLSGGNFRDLAVIAFSAIDKIEISADNMEVSIAGGKIAVNNDKQSMSALFIELIDAIGAITVTTPNGVSGVPNNANKFSEIKMKLGELMN